MSTSEIASILDRQLLLQLGDRLKRLRVSKGLGTVDMAARVGITRNTLRAVESGDPAPSIGTYLRVMSALGIAGELALLAGDTLQPAPVDSAAARSRRNAPVVEVRITADKGRHQLQDLQSLALHEEAVRRVKAEPGLRQRAQQTIERWMETVDPRSRSLLEEWSSILQSGQWRKVLGRTRHAQQLRQASPLVTVLPEEVRHQILAEAGKLKRGVALGGPVSAPPSSERP